MAQNTDGDIPRLHPASSSEKKFLAALWAGAILAGLLQALAQRFYIEPDGVNYLDVAYAYLRHDFHNAVNAYWSPLYSWLLAITIAVTHTASYWESTALHALNLLIYLLSLICFAFFFRELTLLTGKQQNGAQGPSLPSWAWTLFGYSLFVYASLELIRLSTDTPDMLVSAVCFLATGILLRIRRAATHWIAYPALGTALAFGYFAKAAMFPVSFVFLFGSFFAAPNLRKTAPRAALALVTFLLVASPWLVTLSKAEGRFTFGDAGRLAYAWYANGAAAPQRARLISESPQLLEFTAHVSGTYPPWYDPSYWNGNVRPHFEWHGQLHALSATLGEYFRLFSAEKGIVVGLLALLIYSGDPTTFGRAYLKLWPFWLAPLMTFQLYALVHVETRFLGAAVVILWSTLFSAVSLPRSAPSSRVWTSCLLAVIVVIVLTLAAESAGNLSTILKRPQNTQWQIAQELSRLNVRQGDFITVLGHSNITADYYAHLAKVHIVAEIPSEEVPRFWDTDPQSRRHLLDLLAQTGASVLVTSIPPPPSQAPDWQPLGATGYYACVLQKPNHSN